jgi:uncharacterized membrane protein
MEQADKAEGAADRAESGRLAILTGGLLLVIALTLFALAAWGPPQAHQTLLEAGLAFLVFAVGYVTWGVVVRLRAHRHLTVGHQVSGGTPASGHEHT